LKYGIIFLYAISLSAYSAANLKKEEVSIVESWRPAITKYFGEAFCNKFLGKLQESKKDLPSLLTASSMPKIPVIKDDAKSMDVYNKKPDKVILKPEEEAKYHYSFLEELYEVTRQAKPSDDDFKKMMNTLDQGATREGVYHSLVLDSSYGQLESVYRPIKIPATEFAVYFYNTYFAKKISADSFKTMNMYTLKRLVAEKAIDIIDAFDDNREDLEKWYAFLSSDLATRFPQHWSNKMRKETSKDVHKTWASKAPIQHIKSETVIKIHTVFNSLM
jgi:hypothetical protein